jgi:hypothetical protein
VACCDNHFALSAAREKEIYHRDDGERRKSNE